MSRRIERARKTPKSVPGSHLRTTLKAMTVAALTALAMVVTAAPPASAAAKPKVIVSVSPRTVTVGKSSVVTGTVKRGAAKQVLTLQRKAGKKWVKVSSKKLPTKGSTKKVKFTVKVSAPVAQSYRLTLSKKGRTSASTTKPFTIKGVNPPPVAPPAPPVTTPPVTTPPVTTPPKGALLVSRTSSGGQPDDDSGYAAISADGRYVAFESDANNLAGPSNFVTDVFRWDRLTNQVILVSHAPGGGSADNDSGAPVISADGAYIAYESTASNLDADAPTGPNGSLDAVRWSAATNTSIYVSKEDDTTLGNDGSSNVAISGDGASVTFSSLATNLDGGAAGSEDVFVWTASGVTLVSHSGSTDGNGSSIESAVSADGRYVAFSTLADNLIPGDSNGAVDIYRWDRDHPDDLPLLISTGAAQWGDGASGHPSISADGNRIAFDSWAGNFATGDDSLQDVFVRDVDAGTTTWVSHGPGQVAGNGSSRYASISADGQHVAYASNANNLAGVGSGSGTNAVWAWKAATNATQLVSTKAAGGSSSGAANLPTISSNGTWVAFESSAADLMSPALTAPVRNNIFVAGPRS